jgi:RNA polymerase sigma-70 factor (ECF subfamily)
VNHGSLLVAQPLAKPDEGQHDGDECRKGEILHDSTTSELDTPRRETKLRGRAIFSATFEPPHRYKGGVNEEVAPDAEILLLLHAGQDSRAFELLLERFQGKVFRLAMSYVRSPADAEDMTQEVLVRLWRALVFYDGRASFSTWIYAIARNACLSELRKRRSRPVALSEAVEPRLAEGPMPAPASDLRLDCATLLETLPETQRRVVRLFYLEDRSYEEVSILLDMPLNTVRSHLHRARRRLAHLLGARA